MEQTSKTFNKNMKNSDSKKSASTPSNTTTKKQNRKRENPIRFTPSIEQFLDFVSPTNNICKNSACRAVFSKDVDFCKRCSCCICHQFDDNKDPSLWLVCEAESASRDSCGLSCHVECAFEKGKVGVLNPGQYMDLDGTYCCYSCGKVSGILRFWKKQLDIAKDARRVDVLCYRIYLSYRLLYGTVKFKNLHEIITEAKTKLEAEMDPINGDSVKMVRGIASRLSCALDVQKLCSLAIDKANELLENGSTMILNGNVVAVDSPPPTSFRFMFEDVTSSSLEIVMIDIPTPMFYSIIGYKLFYRKSQDEISFNKPSSIFSREKTRISITNLEPSTEYTFRIVSYSESGDLGHSEAKCFTKNLDVVKENRSIVDWPNSNLGGLEISGSKMRDLGNVVHLSWVHEQGLREGSSSADVAEGCGVTKGDDSPKIDESPPISRDLDLNVVSLSFPDLNEEFTPPRESSKDEHDNDHDAPTRDAENNGLGPVKSNGNGLIGDSRAQAQAGNPNGDALGSDSLTKNPRKRASSAKEEALECDSTLMNDSKFRASDGSGPLDGNFEYCVKVMRALECDGHIKQEFRLKMLTWFSLRSTEQERRVVNTFIRTFKDDPKGLAAQLVDTFGELITSKRPRTSFTSVPA